MKILSLVLILFSIQSCCKADCFSGGLNVSFENFRTVDVDTIVLIKYQPNTQQTLVVDTSYRIRNAAPSDTLRSYLMEYLHYGYDWKIVLPSLNKTHTVSDIEQRTAKCCGGKSKRVVAYKLNNVLKQGDYLKLE